MSQSVNKNEVGSDVFALIEAKANSPSINHIYLIMTINVVDER